MHADLESFAMPNDHPSGAEPAANPFELPAEDFRRLGHRMIDQLADYFETIGTIPAERALERQMISGVCWS